MDKELVKMTEELVSFQTAKKLKEVGFDIPVSEFYLSQTESLYEEGDMFELNNHNEYPDVISAPTQSLAQKWLLEIHKIWVEMTLWEHGWNCIIKRIEEDGIYNRGLVNTPSKDRVEIFEAGLLKALETIRP